MPAVMPTELAQNGRLDQLIDELVRATAPADDAWSTSGSASFSQRGRLAARDEAVDRFVRRVLEELPPPADADPGVEVALRALARQKIGAW
jgi:hypothetical protein